MTDTRKEFTDADRAALKELSPVTNEIAEQFASDNGYTVYQVRAVAVRSDDIEYQSKPKTRKDGSKVELKSEITADIADMLGTDAETVESLQNAKRDVLVMVRNALDSE